MTTAINEQLDEVMRLRKTDAAEVLSDALRAGMHRVYTDAILAAYLDGTLHREEAIARVGLKIVNQAESERDLLRQDIEWGLHG